MSYFALGDDDLILNTAARVPVCLCLDVSGSMGNCISELSRGVELFYEEVKKDSQASNSCEIAVVTFSSTVQKVEDFSSVEHKNPVNFTASGGTDMTGGVRMALDLLEERKQKYKDSGVDYYQPWFVIMTDGAPNDRTSLAPLQSKIREMESNGKITVFPIGVGDAADMSVLGGFSGKKTPVRLKNNNFNGFFEFLGKSMSIVSASKVGEKIRLDTSTMSEWAQI